MKPTRFHHNIALVEGDTHISQWVIDSNRLDHDQNTLPLLLPHIKPGDVVIDVGAFIGDHTHAYLNAVGENGRVMAFEPNPEPYVCLLHNCPRAVCYPFGLGTQIQWMILDKNKNAGATSLSRKRDRKDQGEALIMPLDTFGLMRVNFMKIDAEGFELNVLRGAASTIDRCRPIIVLELNDEALAKQETNKQDVLRLMERWHYKGKLLFDGHSLDMPQTDAIFFP